MCHAYSHILLRPSFATFITLGRNTSSLTIGSVTRAAAPVQDYMVNYALWNLLPTCADGCWSPCAALIIMVLIGPNNVSYLQSHSLLPAPWCTMHHASCTLHCISITRSLKTFFFSTRFSFQATVTVVLCTEFFKQGTRNYISRHNTDIILQFAIDVAVTTATARRWFAHSTSVSLAWCSQPCNAGHSCLK